MISLRRSYRILIMLVSTALVVSACNTISKTNSSAAPLMIAEQGSFTVGGTVIREEGKFDPIKLTSAGQTLHGDHAYVFYQIPVDEREFPLVMWHGFGQFSKTWESTPDGREGYQNIFLRRGYGVYLIDQPRRGNAAKGMQPGNYEPIPNEQMWFNTFRVGTWPDYFPNVQFPTDDASLEQYLRQMVPDVGPININVNADAVEALFAKIGNGILVTHSHSGGMGWQAAMQSQHIKAIVSYEPGSNFVFPEGEVPAPKQSSSGTLSAVEVPLDDFKRLTQIPIVIYYGDNIPEKPSHLPGEDGWRIRLEMAYEWADTINRHGGDATVIHLPKIGIYGNTHFPFSDLNNAEIATLMSDWLHEKGLD